MLPTDATERKSIPVYSGFVKYFPRAMAAVATVSKLGNDQHNPGEPLHWSREKSSDHHDCAMRHLMGAGTKDSDGQLHSAKMAWRAMAILELELEANASLDHQIEAHEMLSSKEMWAVVQAQQEREVIDITPSEEVRFNGVPIQYLPSLGNPDPINVTILNVETGNPKCYLGGAMTGFDKLNFPAFDEHKGYLESVGYDVISPADLDRAAGIDENNYRLGSEAFWPKLSTDDLRNILDRDIQALLSLRPGKDAIALMPGWEKSTGACAEFFFARWHGLNIIDTHGISIDAADVDFTEICTRVMKYLRERIS